MKHISTEVSLYTLSLIFWVMFISVSSSIINMAKASETDPVVKVMFGGWSHHYTEGEYNEDHDMVGLQYNTYSLTSFTNSYGNQGYSVSKELPLDSLTGALRGTVCSICTTSVDVGLVTGYEIDVLPMAMPKLSLQVGKFGIELRSLPGVVSTANFTVQLN